jgi:hypothetical protein
MNNEQKAQRYKNLMYEFDILSNKINNIKGQNFELSDAHQREINQLKMKQNQIMQMVEQLMK